MRKERQVPSPPGGPGAARPVAAARQLGLVSKPGMFVLGRPGRGAARGGKEGVSHISSSFSLQPFGLMLPSL